MSDPRVVALLALGDDELITGHRLGEWTGWVPYVEEDLALSSIGQDELGHARALYEIAASLGAADDADAVAFGRRPGEYRNAVLCERPNRDFSFTIARHYLYDTACDVRTESLVASSMKDLASLSGVMRIEERYHLDHARTWFRRLAEGPVEARHRLTGALAATLGEAIAIFEPLPGEPDLVADGTLPATNEDLLGRWLEILGADLEAVGLERVLESGAEADIGELVPTSSGAAEAGEAIAPLRVPGLERMEGRWVHIGRFEGEGGRQGRRSSDFGPLWEEMTSLYRAHPGATW